MAGNLTITGAFAKYGAKLANPKLAVSSIADDGSLVVSCWSHCFDRGGLRWYEDNLLRWDGNAAGTNLMREHLRQAYDGGLRVRLIIATSLDAGYVDSGPSGSKVTKKYHVRPDVVGQVTEFDGDRFVIEFEKATI